MKRCALILLLFAAAPLAAQSTLHLAIGDPARKDKESRLVLDAITATVTGDLLTPKEAVSRLAGTRLLFMGESHTSMDFHRIQKRIIEELYNAGRKVQIGLEMYPHTEQEYLDDWVANLYTESGFVGLSQWYRNWGYNWNYYRDIFLFARDHGIRMFALNAPREIVSAVSRKGIANLTPEERSRIAPKIDTGSEEHFTLFKSYFEEETGMHSMMSDSQARAMFASQCTWDATMGYIAVRALKEQGDENTIMIVLIGSGHVAYGLGIQRQSAQWFDGKMASLIPIEVRDEKDRPVESIRSSYADYIWGIPQEKDPLYPDLGISTADVPGEARRRVIVIDDKSPAKAAGFQVGDVLISMDGTPLTGSEVLNRLTADKRWGDSAVFVVRRQSKEGGPQELTLKVIFRRTNPAPKSGAGSH